MVCALSARLNFAPKYNTGECMVFQGQIQDFSNASDSYVKKMCPLSVKPHPFEVYCRQKLSYEWVRICLRAIQRSGVFEYLEREVWGLDFVHIHQVLSRILVKRGARAKLFEPPWIRHWSFDHQNGDHHIDQNFLFCQSLELQMFR